MAKSKATVTELIAMIEVRIEGFGHINVFPDKELGWRAEINTTPSQAVRLQAQVDSVVRELREIYDLADLPHSSSTS
jgi:hypothetical protein